MGHELYKESADGQINPLSGRKSFYILAGLSILLVCVASIFGADALIKGRMHVYGLTRDIPLGLLIATYIFFVVTSTGLCIVASIGDVFGVKEYMPIATRTVFMSIVMILSGFFVIFFDLENPFRMAIYNIISPNFTSNIWWMGTLYVLYTFFMIFELIFLLLYWHRLAKMAGLAAVLCGIGAHSNLGAIFGMSHCRQFWYGPYMPIYFIASAIMLGCAALIFFTYIAYRLANEPMEGPMESAMRAIGKLTALMICILMFFTIWKIITGLVGGEPKRVAILAMLKGPYAINFWIFEVLAGMVLPLVILLKFGFKNMKTLFYASLSMIIGIFFMRYDLVVIGHIVPVLYELHVREFSGLLSYTPSLHEIMISAGGFGIAFILFLIGEKFFKGHKFYIQ